jgi:hypothetical protein
MRSTVCSSSGSPCSPMADRRSTSDRNATNVSGYDCRNVARYAARLAGAAWSLSSGWMQRRITSSASVFVTLAGDASLLHRNVSAYSA